MRTHRPAIALLLLAVPSSVFGQSFGPDAPRQVRFALKVDFRTPARPVESPAELPALARIDLKWRPGTGTVGTRQAVEPGPCQAWMDAVAKRAAEDQGLFGMSTQSMRKWDGVGEILGSLIGGFLSPYEPPSAVANRQFVTDLARGTTWDKGLPVWGPGCAPPTSAPPIAHRKRP